MDYKEKLKDIINSNKTPFVDIDTFLKYFPELKESEDERIRNFISNELACLGATEGKGSDRYKELTNAIAWLEKQGEHAKFLNKIQIGDKVTRNQDGVLVNLSQLERVAKPAEEYNITGIKSKYAQGKLGEMIKRKLEMEKQGEQKPVDKIEPKFKNGDRVRNIKTGKESVISEMLEYVYGGTIPFYIKDQDEWELVEQKSVEWSTNDLPEFESYLCLMFQKFRTKGVCTNGEIVDFVKEHSQKLKDTLCHAWSEEDEKQLNDIIRLLPGLDIRHNWLKSLKDRVRPQPVWSKEDDETLCKCISATFDHGYLKECDWLKSFRPQSQWKPSDEQMLAINTAINVLGKGTINGKYLIELHEQLKKLREE